MYPGSAKTGFVDARGEVAGAVKVGTAAEGADCAGPACLRACFLAGAGDLRVAMGLAPSPAWGSVEERNGGWYEDPTQDSKICARRENLVCFPKLREDKGFCLTMYRLEIVVADGVQNACSAVRAPGAGSSPERRGCSTGFGRKCCRNRNLAHQGNFH